MKGEIRMANSTSKKKKTTTRKYNSSARKSKKRMEQELWAEVGLIILFAFMLFLFLCNFGLVGPVGTFFKNVMFGLFGWMAYVFPIFLFVITFFNWINKGNKSAHTKVVASSVLYFILCTCCEFMAGRLKEMDGYHILELYKDSVKTLNGGGVFGGSIAYGLYKLMDIWGSVLILVVVAIVCLVLITGKSFVKGLQRTSQTVIDKTKNGARDMSDYAHELAKTRERADKRPAVRGVNFGSVFTKLEDQTEQKPKPVYDKKEIDDRIAALAKEAVASNYVEEDEKPVEEQPTLSYVNVESDELRELRPKTRNEVKVKPESKVTKPEPLKPTELTLTKPTEIENDVAELTYSNEQPQMKMVEKKRMPKPYIAPPISLLQKGKGGNQKNSQRYLEDTARRLQDCLRTFGVNVTITDISQGPAVTRYELQPELGVKVSKIVNLADDIKLNLAAADIRIEAPIPGKSAIGIEVPNKENSAVNFRDLVESNEFKTSSSKITFAVGKDIAGKNIVADIAKMPHMLIAGATGSGKSVCINTLIMSILYKATPDEVKLIMIDPKVVELSAYNGIPHLLIPVVTDPKHAAGALQWGVSEMMSRYEKFAEFNVRDMKGYNAKVEEMIQMGAEDAPKKLPQIVIIVDELADLMMVASKEVEEAICRLAQLARAAGIHLIVATQRPSVDVITGLIKANMPSRVAFAVSSGVDSRTILDMNGAEKLLGKGDMLFYPQGYTKPLRIQGCFVSDQEVAAVVDFLKNQKLGNVYEEDIQNQINEIRAGGGNNAGGNSNSYSDDKDVLFADAGRFIIEKEKASIGMLQRVFKIGFNRAARIVDQLCEYGVVGEEEGTKPRKVLMTMEQFENLLEEI